MPVLFRIRPSRRTLQVSLQTTIIALNRSPGERRSISYRNAVGVPDLVHVSFETALRTSSG
jgi:hypothetical protein